MTIKHKNSPITSKKPQTWLEINAEAFNHNVSYYKNIIGPDNKLAAVIKGNGYGHGLHEMAYLCEQNKSIDWMCVAQLSEALALENISKPILVFNYSDISVKNAVGKNIHFMVDTLEYAQTLNNIGKQHSHTFSVHVKIDSGLSRMGVFADNALAFIQQLQQLDNIAITGIFSHFSASDTDPELTKNQLSLFNDVVTTINNNNIAIEHVHMANSAAISLLTYPKKINFFRAGIGLYGLGHDRAHLKPVLTWKTHITSIKTVPANTSISYYGEYITTRETRIALLPLGYYDGYQYRFSNKASVVINGSYAPTIGRIAMNVAIVDVTDITAAIGDEVTLLGEYPGVKAHDLAKIATIDNVREIFIGINRDFTRIITE